MLGENTAQRCLKCREIIVQNSVAMCELWTCVCVCVCVMCGEGIAGGGNSERRRGRHGCDRVFAVNYLGHFLLVNLFSVYLRRQEIGSEKRL